MKLHTILDILGKVLKTDFIVKRDCVSDTTFKVYKTYSIKLYKLQDKEVQEILRTQITDKITDANKDIIVERAEKEFLKTVFEKYARYID